ncbi:hypothetical protein BV898_07456 [Hypsibius exemplaris]|uniref:PAS domain-containing protein n=1 Tax=Hypsibius exemplaris TaxID=2072580 RepID=A0A1W0WTC9_HYPEX|nr:hypothetical protein BV898_07456 [Hypsibius exemplaris]
MDQLKSVKLGDGFLLVIDEFGKMIYVSESALQHTGFRALDLNGQSWFSLLHPDDQVYSRAHLREAVTRCRQQQQQKSVVTDPALPTPSPTQSPANANEATAAAGGGSDFRSSLSVRLLQGNRPRKGQTTTTTATMTSSNAPNDDTHPQRMMRLNGSQNESAAETVDPDTGDAFVYRAYHFSGAARAITIQTDVNGVSGWMRNIVWVAVGRTSKQPGQDEGSENEVQATVNEALSDGESTPSHFVLRHDLTGRINYVDRRCKYFTGYDFEDLRGQVIFDHLVLEDSRHLRYQYDQLKRGRESIAVVYRFRGLGKTKDNGGDTYLNCRAYLTLNPVTFQSDQVTSLAASISEEEGRAEIEKQALRQTSAPKSQASNNAHHDDGQTKILLTCSVQYKCNGSSEHSDKENCRSNSTKSPQQSPDSNTHPIDISPLSNGANGNGGPLVDQVAIIDSQYSPSKHTTEDDANAAGTLSQALQTHSPTANTTKSIASDKSSGKRHGSKTKLSSSSIPRNLNQMVKSEDRENQRKPPAEPSSLQSHHYFLPGSEARSDTPGRNIPNIMFHDQLREKHLYLEESIRNQQLQLQMLQQKLMTLANHGAGIYPMQMQLQGPLSKVMELQNRVGRHRDEAIQQRSLVDGRILTSPMQGASLLRRNSTPQMPVTSRAARAGQPNFSRRSSIMAENIIYDQSAAETLPSATVTDFESGRQSANVLSPPFVDVNEPMSVASSAASSHSFQHQPQQSRTTMTTGSRAPSVDPLDALYNSLELGEDSGSLGPDFEEKLRELEMLFTPSFIGNNNGSANNGQGPSSDPGDPRSSDTALPYKNSGPASLSANLNDSS